ncbi:hypothetical protein VNO80_26902 [Phaseolus coccineus]|uniref:Uncharacterized protein n=1 Tax=Phaseolus coccineus TaxID=3886 RepID=A0AAN9LJC1_PHACN
MLTTSKARQWCTEKRSSRALAFRMGYLSKNFPTDSSSQKVGMICVTLGSSQSDSEGEPERSMARPGSSPLTPCSSVDAVLMMATEIGSVEEEEEESEEDEDEDEDEEDCIAREGIPEEEDVGRDKEDMTNLEKDDR